MTAARLRLGRHAPALHPAVVVGLVSFFWFALTAGLRPLTMPDEGRYAGVAASMAASGDWLVPRLASLPFFHKPPLFYWIGAASMQLLGASEWAARVPSMLGAACAVVALYVAVRRVDEALARLAALVLATTPFFFIGAQFANMDMLVAGLIAGAVVAGTEAQRRVTTGDARPALLLAFALAALAVLAKGLIGFVLPAAIVFTGALWSGRWREAVRAACYMPGWLLFAVIALPWFVSMQLRFPDFFDYFVVTQHFRRFAGTGFNNAQPFWFYVPVMLVLSLPWTPWLLRWRPAAGSGVRDLDRTMLCWLLVVLVFFSLPASKLIGYVLPALPPLAYFAARGLALFLAGGVGRARWQRAGTGLAVAVCVVAAFATTWHERQGDSLVLRRLAPRFQEGDDVVMLGDYFYQVPFYWHGAHRIRVVADWRPEVAGARDNWRKELFDAGRFDETAGAAALVDTVPTSCGRTTWFVGGRATQLPAQVQGALLVASEGAIRVWRCAP